MRLAEVLLAVAALLAALLLIGGLRQAFRIPSRSSQRQGWKELRAGVRAFFHAIDWWVATKMLVILMLGLGVIVWVIRWFL